MTEQSEVFDLDAALQFIKWTCAKIPEKEKAFFARFSEKIDDFLFRFHSPQIRIALIGITSSGKSTLLNRLLTPDEEFERTGKVREYLPMCSAPSSGRQVLCCYGESPRVEILFEDGQAPLIFSNPERISKILSEFGDEKNNPNNKYKIKEIHLFSPDFSVDRNLVFVDTPGLDAYRLDYHERITLNLVLPTVDMVMYLTTVKVDSDAKNLKYVEGIDAATSSLKPLIMVQNQIDSISEKVSSRGVDKTKQEIRQEHYNRLKKLLSRAHNPSVKSASIVQISAKTGQGVEQLRQALNVALAEYRNRRVDLYRRQLNRELKEMEQSLSEVALASADKERKRRQREQELSRYEADIKAIESSFRTFAGQYETMEDDVEKLFRTLTSSIEAKYATGTEGEYKDPERLSPEIVSQIEEFRGAIGYAGAKFDEYVKKSRQLIQQSCNNLNLEEKQVYQAEFYKKTDNTVADCTRAETRFVLVRKKRNFFDRIWRRYFTDDPDPDFDDSESHTESYVVQDIKEKLKSIVSLYQQFCNSNDDNLPKLRTNTENCTKRLNEELVRKKNELKNRFSVEVSSRTAELILTMIRKYIGKDENPPNPFASGMQIQPVPLPEDDPDIEYEADPLVYDLFQLARSHQYDIHKAFFRDLLERSGLPDVRICGWDRETCDLLREFGDIFISDELNGDGRVRIINFNCCTERDLPRQDNSLVFLLLNADQSGSAKSSLHKCVPTGPEASPKYPGTEWLKRASFAGRIVWVMDSVKAARGDRPENDTLMEAFHEMELIVRDFQRTAGPFDIMALDEDLYYSVLFHELYFNSERWTLQGDREKFIEQMRAVFLLDNEQADRTGYYLNQYLDLTNHKEENPGK